MAVTRLSVLEAAALSGRPPAEIRTLIEQGRLAAERVELPGGAQYLVEARALAALGPLPSTRPPAAATRRRLRAALDGLRAALARRCAADELASEEKLEDGADERGRPMRQLRSAVGLEPVELEALGRRLERLLGTPHPGPESG